MPDSFMPNNTFNLYYNSVKEIFFNHYCVRRIETQIGQVMFLFPKKHINSKRRLGFKSGCLDQKSMLFSICYAHFLFNAFLQAVIVSQNLFLQRIKILVNLLTALI